MPERSTPDAIFIARQMMTSGETKALLRGRGVSERPITVIRDMYEDSIAAIQTPHKDEYLSGLDKVHLWQGALAGNGLRLNVKKTKFVSFELCIGPILDCQGEANEKVEEFRYLGSELFDEGSVDQVVRGRISAAWLKWRKSTGILCDRRCSMTLKGKF
ncbi:unnamed protein product [Heligmosomoides polygyrus]|uniref:Reverse transcriptase domain-containing protein n=1 Tax=Heligmosomoides polygyrus TaxID=6339 RepID=A0A183GGE3_HELPZ|nr:unnamed protein product [Heligmosomoides polygyrus]